MQDIKEPGTEGVAKPFKPFWLQRVIPAIDEEDNLLLDSLQVDLEEILGRMHDWGNREEAARHGMATHWGLELVVREVLSALRGVRPESYRAAVATLFVMDPLMERDRDIITKAPRPYIDTLARKVFRLGLMMGIGISVVTVLSAGSILLLWSSSL